MNNRPVKESTKNQKFLNLLESIQGVVSGQKSLNENQEIPHPYGKGGWEGKDAYESPSNNSHRNPGPNGSTHDKIVHHVAERATAGLFNNHYTALTRDKDGKSGFDTNWLEVYDNISGRMKAHATKHGEFKSVDSGIEAAHPHVHGWVRELADELPDHYSDLRGRWKHQSSTYPGEWSNNEGAFKKYHEDEANKIWDEKY